MGAWAEWAYDQALNDQYAYEQRYKQLLNREVAKMGEVIKGSVHYVSERKVSGDKILYSIKLDNETFYGTGEYKPTCEVGDLVGFEATKNDRGYWNVDKPEAMKIGKGKGTQPPPRTGGGKGGFKGGGGGGYKQDPATQASIIMQSSAKAAVDLVNVAIINEAIALPAKKADRLQAIIDSHAKVTEQIFQQQLGVYIKVKGGSKLEELLATEEVEGVGDLDDPDFDNDVEPTQSPKQEEGAFADDPDFE